MDAIFHRLNFCFMKPIRKNICWLIGALAVTTLAGCADRADNDHRGAYGGYERGQGNYEHGYLDSNGYWHREDNDYAPGSPYERQHVSPRDQMEH